jgi:hypothetical protein
MDDDFDLPQMPSVVDFAYEIVAMHNRLQRLEAENKDLLKYRKLYIEELDRGIKHSGEMIGGLLKIATTPGVMEAVAKANTKVKAQS